MLLYTLLLLYCPSAFAILKDLTCQNWCSNPKRAYNNDQLCLKKLHEFCGSPKGQKRQRFCQRCDELSQPIKYVATNSQNALRDAQSDLSASHLIADDRRCSDWCRIRNYGAECLNELHKLCSQPERTPSSFCTTCFRLKNNFVPKENNVKQKQTKAAETELKDIQAGTQRQEVRDRYGNKMSEKATRQRMNELHYVLNEYGEQYEAKSVRRAPARLLDAKSSWIKELEAGIEEEIVDLTEIDVNNPEEYYQFDISLTERQAEFIINETKSLMKEKHGGREKRKVGRLPQYDRWEDFPIPFTMDSTVRDKKTVREGIEMWELNTCVRFQENGPGTDRIEFTNGGGCSSFVGRSGGTQQITVHYPGCNRAGIVAHELGHALGFFHEQNRPDQKDHITVNYNVLNSRYYNNFLPQDWRTVEDMGVPYDHGSVMHYDGRVRAFQVRGGLEKKYAIVSNDPGYQNVMGQRNGPTFIDYKQVNRVYCDDKCIHRLGCTHDGYEDPNDCDLCKCPDGFGGKLCENVQPSTAGCGGIIEPEEFAQSIQTPNYPRSFKRGTICNWLLKAPRGQKVHLRFSGSFNLQCGEVCSQSFAEVKKGPVWERTGYRFCCDRPDETFISDSEEMVLMFRALGSSSSGGYRVEFWTGGKEPSEVTEAPEVTETTEFTQAFDVETRAPRIKTTTAAPKPIAPVPTINPNEKKAVKNKFFALGDNRCDRECRKWSTWSQGCNYDCGGCGFTIRTRNCKKQGELVTFADGDRNCHQIEKRRCNLGACPGNPTGPTFRNGRFAFFYDGCCAGMVNQGGLCSGFESLIPREVVNMFSGIPGLQEFFFGPIDPSNPTG